MLRSLMEKVARGMVFRRRLPRSFGRRPFYVTPDSALSYLKPGYDSFSDLMTIAESCISDGDCVWDIGANVGVFGILAAHRAGESGRIVCVEPDPVLASLIQRSAQLAENSDRHIDVLCAAVADRSHIAEFAVAARGRSSNALVASAGRTQTGGVRYRQTVPVVTLDLMAETLPAPNCVKIDVEGAEALVLAGGQQVLAEQRPRLYVEVGPAQTTSVTEILNSHGYRLFDGGRPVIDQTPLSKCVFNTLAIPAEQTQDERLAA